MKTVIVNIRVFPGAAEAFVAASLENQRHSRKEPGILRFELLSDELDPCRFVLIEGYRDSAAQAAHKETSHYAAWRDARPGRLRKGPCDPCSPSASSSRPPAG
jgi:quinol monooxygenase YgiN